VKVAALTHSGFLPLPIKFKPYEITWGIPLIYDRTAKLNKYFAVPEPEPEPTPIAQAPTIENLRKMSLI
jgi:hypothetical protein